MFNGCGKPQLKQHRRRRSVSPKFLLTETKYFDEINTNSGSGSDSAPVDDDLDNFSFIDDDISGNSINDYDKSVSIPIESADRKRRAANDNEKVNPHELHYPPMKFDDESDEDLSADSADVSNQGGRRGNKNRNRGSGNGSIQRNRNNNDDDENKESPLDKLVKDIRQKVKDTKKFWSNLPFQICNNDEFAAPPSSDANCWNGVSVDRFVFREKKVV